MIRGLGRDFDNWSIEHRNHCMRNAPRSLVSRLFQYHIGEYARGTVAFSARMHRVADVLMRELKELGTPKERTEIVNDVSNALAIRPWQHYSYPYYDSDNVMRKAATSTAFVVALLTPYPAVVDRMLSKLPASVTIAEECDFGYPLRVSIALALTAQVEKLLPHVEDPRSLLCIPTRRALATAAVQGHADLVKLVLQTIDANFSHGASMHTAAGLLEAAAANQQWHMVTLLMTRYGAQWNELQWAVHLHGMSCWAARYGRNDFLMNANKVNYGGRSPLCEAARGGHLSTCEWLVKNGLSYSEYEGEDDRTESLARFVAKGGSVDGCRFLKQQKLWEPWHEIHFLPIAAELGHLEFAKFAVESGCDSRYRRSRRAKQKFPTRTAQREIKYPDDMRYFALCRAIASGHLDMVRWLVCEIEVPVRQESIIERPLLLPMDLAICAKNQDMIRLLEELHADPVEDVSLDLYERREEVSKHMSFYRDALCLRADYRSYPRHS